MQSINIAGHQIDLYISPSLEAFNPQNRGLFDHNKNDIYIDSHLDKDLKQATLAHEVLHAIFMRSGGEKYLQGFGVDDEAVETLVQILENTFFTFLRGNTNFYEKINLEGEK